VPDALIARVISVRSFVPLVVQKIRATEKSGKTFNRTYVISLGSRHSTIELYRPMPGSQDRGQFLSFKLEFSNNLDGKGLIR
jgi:hypothetical protein